MSRSINIDVMLTKNCNFRCKYCYEKPCNYLNEEITPEVINDLYSYIDWYCDENPSALIKISFWGGEPTIRSDIIDKMVRHYIDNQNITFIVFTNASKVEDILSTSIKANTLQKNKFTTQISYDFAGQKNRVFKNGLSSKKLVQASVKKYVLNDQPFTIKSTIDFMNLPDINKYYLEYKVFQKEIYENIDLAVTVDTTAAWNNSDEEFENILIRTEESMKDLLKNMVKNNETRFNWFNGTRALCTAGKKFFCVDTDGKVYPCHGVVFEKEKDLLCRGNISEHKYFDFEFDVIREPQKCKECDVCVCFRCNAHMFGWSNIPDIAERWCDFGKNDKYCRIQKLISKYVYAYKKIMESKQ